MKAPADFELVTVEEEDPDRLDQLLGILSTADWITPAMSLARGGATLAIPRAEAAEAAAVLRAARIPSWSWQVSGHYMLLDVCREDARRACRLLDLQYEKPPSAWSGRVLLVMALGSGALLAWFMFAMLTIGGGLR